MIYDLFVPVLIIGLVMMSYLGYWAAYCWAWYLVWPSGPEWLVRPHVFSFLLVNITGVIITLMILSRASE